MAINELIAETLMIPLAMIMLGVFLHGATKVALARRDDLCQAFRLDRADEPLGVCVQVRTSCGKANWLDAGSLENDFERLREQRRG